MDKKDIELNSYDTKNSKNTPNSNFSIRTQFLTAFVYLAVVFFILLFMYVFIFLVSLFRETESTKNPPYIAKIIYRNGSEIKFGCTAFLISNSMLITAAHCLQFDPNISIFAIHIGGKEENNYEDTLKIPGTNLKFKTEYDLANGDIGTIKLIKPIIPTEAVHPIRVASHNSRLPKKLKFIKWLDNDIDKMDSVQVTVSVIDEKECIRRYQTVDKTVNFHAKNNKTSKSIAFCTDGGYIKAGNSGTPLVDRNGYAFGLLSSGPTETFSIPNVFADLRAFIDQIDGNIILE